MECEQSPQRYKNQDQRKLKEKRFKIDIYQLIPKKRDLLIIKSLILLFLTE